MTAGKWITVIVALAIAVILGGVAGRTLEQDSQRAATSAPAVPGGLIVATPAPSTPAPALNVAACAELGGTVLYAYSECSPVDYVGTDGSPYWTTVNYDPATGQLAGPVDTAGTGATETECKAGRYPDGPAGPVTKLPGRWDAKLALCLLPAGARDA